MALRITAFDRAVLAQTRSLHPGAYVTDGLNLFQVCRKVVLDNFGWLVELENCRTLALTLHCHRDFDRVAMWPVRLGSESAAPAG
jgi:hypothetical protein